MAYVDQPAMSTRKIVSISLVVLLHALIGYAFITGLAMSVVKKVAKDLSVVDVVEEPPPPVEPPPPPPPEQKIEPPPLVSPPPIVSPPQIQAPVIQTVPVAPPPVITPTAPVAPPPPPAPTISKAAAAKGNPGSWVTQDDYPSSSIRNEEQGTTGLTFDVNSQGRIENCRITTSSGSPTLDNAACSLVTRRGRYSPALDAAGNPTGGGTKTLRFTWQLPKD
ncbi:TonB family protein [Sphingomonas naphthae]|uniref:TonB family protein n=1 Tax=Sphingomonas naphthae TaxID=1813468 RepID=A0ABY7TH58_9SPHN|nr:energy transducer TonB [Sphingomonas naphthae]WCT72557.1 TonB family protein [Sphingomonas naphthae]